MVSEKLIIVLITLAILMSVASIVITVSTLNTSMIPEIKPQLKVIEGRDSGQVSIGIVKPTVPPVSKTPSTPVTP
jgi:hypothetical protein